MAKLTINLKQLEEALRYKLRKNPKATEFKFKNQTLHYEGEGGIFDQAREHLIPTHLKTGFEDTEKGHLEMAEELIKAVDREQGNLETYIKPSAAESGEPSNAEEPLTSPEGETGTQELPGGEPASTMVGGHAPGIPQTRATAPSTRFQPPPTETPPEEGQKLFVANKSGKITDELSVTPEGTYIKKPDPSTIQLAGKSGAVTGEHPVAPQESIPVTKEAPKLVIAGKGGAVTGEHTVGPGGNPPSVETPKIQIAGKGGAIIHGPETSSPKIHLANKAGVITGEHPLPSSPKLNTGGFKAPSAVINSTKNIGSSASILTNKASRGLASGLGQMAKGLGRGIAGPGLTSTYNLLGKAGTGSLNAFSRLSGQFGGRGGVLRGGLFGKNTGRKVVWLFLGFFIFFGIFAGIMGGSNGEVPPTPPILPTVPIASDISSCKFTRAGNPQPVKSSILLGWIVSAATQAGIPPQVLASVAMHESQSLVANADDNHDAIKSGNYCNYGQILCINRENTRPLHNGACTGEELGDGANTARAVGLMQLIDIYNSGKGDLCDIKNSLAIAAAKLKADGVTAQPTQPQINTAIRRYYNSCEYGSYNYCNEVWQDLQSCQPTTPGGTTHPTAPTVPPSELKQKIKDTFGITMNGFNDRELQWAWEKFNQVSNTKFISHVRGSVVEKGGRSEQVGCPGAAITAWIKDYSSFSNYEPFFKYILIHELGHAIQICDQSRAIGNFATQHNNAFNEEGGITHYSRNSTGCGARSLNEDYAEMVARYLNPGTSVQLGSSCNPPGSEVVDLRSQFPLHYNVARSVLGEF